MWLSKEKVKKDEAWPLNQNQRESLKAILGRVPRSHQVPLVGIQYYSSFKERYKGLNIGRFQRFKSGKPQRWFFLAPHWYIGW
jgi:hypothetical protein